MATEASASAVVAPEATCAQAVRGAASGGVSPVGASCGTPKSMTSATRLLPSVGAVAPQTAAKSAAARGWAACAAASLLTEKRKPCTEPSAGRASDGPWVAYDQPPPAEPSQNDQ